MKLKLVKIGNSYSVRIPIRTARPFIESGEIDIKFPEDIPFQPETIKKVNKIESLINPAESIEVEPKEETRWERIAKRYG